MNFLYLTNVNQLTFASLQSQKKILTKPLCSEIDKLKFDKDKCRNLIGKMLLLYVLQRHEDYKANYLPIISYGRYKKPRITSMKGHFNISHANDWVVCVYNDNSVIGVDLEYHIPIRLNDYKAVMTASEFQDALLKPSFDFFKLWTLKEAVMKAEGAGFFLSPSSFNLPSPFYHNASVTINDNRWYLASKRFMTDYTLSLASLEPIEQPLNQQIVPINLLIQNF